MGFPKLKEFTIAHHEIKSKQRDVLSVFFHQKFLKDPNILKFRKVKSIILIIDHITDQYCGNALHYSKCFLKYCFFCHKPISLHKEVHIYRYT